MILILLMLSMLTPKVELFKGILSMSILEQLRIFNGSKNITQM